MKFQLVKNKAGKPIPASDEDREKYNTIEYGEVFECRGLDQRNVRFHRQFFAMIDLAFQNMPEKYDNQFPTSEDLREELIKRAGFYHEYTDFKGNKQQRAESIRFDNMGQKRFEEVYNGVLDVILKWLMPKVERDVLKHEIMNFM